MAKRFPSELRFDLVSKDWVIIATGRARKPTTFQKNHKLHLELKQKECPFDTLKEQEETTSAFLNGERISIPRNTYLKDWTTVSILNKYPAFSHGTSIKTRHVGPYEVMDGVGHHEVIVTRDHKKDIPDFSIEKVRELIEVYHQRFLELMQDKLVNYITIFKNKGAAAGASVAHPHSQMLAIPVTDPDLQRSMRGSLQYQQERNRCVHCAMLNWDREDKTRIIFENKGFVAVCPFASRVAFEIRIYPTKHSAYFEKIDDKQKDLFAQALQVTLKKLKKALKDPDYNYFIHTSPVDGENHDHYHWHLEILPKTSTWAGFELGTGIEISTIEPEKAAEFLRKN